jgi:hypothetical protein
MWGIFLATYLASHVWLSGSFLLPCMLLVRWWAPKGKLSSRLATSKKYWILSWGSYGLAETALFSALLLYWWHREQWGEPPFDLLGWASMTARSVLYLFHIDSGDVMAFALGLSLRAVSEMAIDAGLAGIAWWAYEFFSRDMRTQGKTGRYAICFLLVTCVLGIANNSYFWHSGCSDCFAPHGIPFTFFHEGGFAGGEGFVWTGVLENSIVVLVVSVVSGVVWRWD